MPLSCCFQFSVSPAGDSTRQAPLCDLSGESAVSSDPPKCTANSSTGSATIPAFPNDLQKLRMPNNSSTGTTPCRSAGKNDPYKPIAYGFLQPGIPKPFIPNTRTPCRTPSYSHAGVPSQEAVTTMDASGEKAADLTCQTEKTPKNQRHVESP